MCKHRKCISVLIFLLGIFINLSAQKSPIKFGKIDPADFEITDCNFEPGASAMVLEEYGEGNFEVDNWDGSVYYEMNYHVRIKILSKNGLDEANIELDYFAGESGDYESVRQIRAASYNFDNGQIIRQEVKNKDLHRIDLGKDWKTVKFAIPGVREGSIIEYQYVLRTEDYYNLEPWYFQKEIPVKNSHFCFEVPEALVFQSIFRGNQMLDSSFVDESRAFLSRHHWLMRELPSFRREPYAAAQRDFSPHIEFQLMRVDFRNGPDIDIITDYAKLNQRLLNNFTFGKVAEPGRFEKNLVQDIVAGLNDNKEKAAAILNYFQKNVAWNEERRLFADLKANEVVNKGSGDAASINLALTACLRAAGLDADPVILGTRDYGRPHPMFPNLEKFNYVVVAVDLDGKTVFADATDPDLPLGYISEHCLHAEGWRVRENNPGWIPLQTDASADFTVYLELKPDGENWSGKASFRNTNYAATKALENIRKDKNAYLQALVKSLEAWNPENAKYLEIDKSGPKMTAEAEISRQIDLEDLIYLEPIYTGWFSENPFDANDRVSPVDFPYLMNFNYVVRIQLPEGYEVSELPENMAVAFGNDQGLLYKYRCSINNGWLMVVSNLRMNRKYYLPEEYPDLREFFDYIVSKNQEIVVLAHK